MPPNRGKLRRMQHQQKQDFWQLYVIGFHLRPVKSNGGIGHPQRLISIHVFLPVGIGIGHPGPHVMKSKFLFLNWWWKNILHRFHVGVSQCWVQWIPLRKGKPEWRATIKWVLIRVLRYHSLVLRTLQRPERGRIQEKSKPTMQHWTFSLISWKTMACKPV